MPFGEVVTFVNGDRGSNYPKANDYRASGVPFVSAVDIATGYLDLANSKKISPEAYERLRNGKIQRDDLLYCLRGSIGKSALVRDDSQGAIASSLVIIRGSDRADIRFVQYFLSSPMGQRLALRLDNGSVQPNISVRDLRQLEVPLPSIPEQAAIVEALGSIDDRIESLRQTNATLEAIAQALFKSWFVDFDPVRAKAEGREPEGMDAATAALFPNEFEDSELGPIPKGWKTENFEREFDFTMGQSPPGSTYNQDGIGVPFFQGSTDFGDVFPAERVFCTEPTRFARAGDLLMSVRAPVGALNIANIDCSIGRGLCAIRHKSGSTGFTQQSVQACLVRIENAAGEGAVFKSLSKKQLADLPVVVADGPVVDAMVSHLEPLAARRIAGARQAQRLAELRDTLLPRLISGKLRLPDAERKIEAATA